MYQLTHRLDEEGIDDAKVRKKEKFRIKPYKDAVPTKDVCRGKAHTCMSKNSGLICTIFTVQLYIHVVDNLSSFRSFSSPQ